MDVSERSRNGMLMKAFPPGHRGVLVPMGDRRTAAAGICLYTASKPWVVLGQRAARFVIRRAGGHVLPGRVQWWSPPCSYEEWVHITRQWRDAVGAFDGLACYQRRQHTRAGLTLLLTAAGRPKAVVKLRDDGDGLAREQQALQAIQGSAPRSFHAPRALGLGVVGGAWHWSAQTAVFTRPHRPILDAPAQLFEEVSGSLGYLASSAPDQCPAHNDLTPWNLRQDSRGEVWLFDWEDCGSATQGSDRTYFAACARALGGPPMPADLPVAAIDHWRAVLTSRSVDNAADAALGRRLLRALA